MSTPFKPGDIVHHLPSGEQWVVKRSGFDTFMGRSGFVEPAGWPPCRARADDCVIVAHDPKWAEALAADTAKETEA